jgi:hypothetical protein
MASSPRSADLATRWRDAFLAILQRPENAAPLKEAALGEILSDWTRHLTAVVVQSCQSLDWCAAAKGFALDLLPQVGQEYLGIDVMAFEKPRAGEGPRWRFPLAVFELENSRGDDRVAYSLWKVLCLRSRLRVVFAYRRDWEEARSLVNRLAEEVVGAFPVNERGDLRGQTLLVTGSRGEGATFPWGYFKLWELDPNLGRFRTI